MIWMKAWIREAIATDYAVSEKATPGLSRTRQILQERGLKRLRRDVLGVPGRVCFEPTQQCPMGYD